MMKENYDFSEAVVGKYCGKVRKDTVIELLEAIKNVEFGNHAGQSSDGVVLQGYSWRKIRSIALKLEEEMNNKV